MTCYLSFCVFAIIVYVEVHGFFNDESEKQLLFRCCLKSGRECAAIAFLSDEYYNAVTCAFEELGYLKGKTLDAKAVKHSIVFDSRFQSMTPDDQRLVSDDCLRTGEEEARRSSLVMFACVNNLMSDEDNGMLRTRLK